MWAEELGNPYFFSMATGIPKLQPYSVIWLHCTRIKVSWTELLNNLIWVRYIPSANCACVWSHGSFVSSKSRYSKAEGFMHKSMEMLTILHGTDSKHRKVESATNFLTECCMLQGFITINKRLISYTACTDLILINFLGYAYNLTVLSLSQLWLLTFSNIELRRFTTTRLKFV